MKRFINKYWKTLLFFAIKGLVGVETGDAVDAEKGQERGTPP